MVKNFYFCGTSIVTDLNQAVGENRQPIIGMVSFTEVAEEIQTRYGYSQYNRIETPQKKIVPVTGALFKLITDNTEMELYDENGENQITLEEL